MSPEQIDKELRQLNKEDFAMMRHMLLDIEILTITVPPDELKEFYQPLQDMLRCARKQAFNQTIEKSLIQDQKRAKKRSQIWDLSCGTSGAMLGWLLADGSYIAFGMSLILFCCLGYLNFSDRFHDLKKYKQ